MLAMLEKLFCRYYNGRYSLLIYFGDTIMAVIMKTPAEISLMIAQQARRKRLELNLSQNTLATRSGVSYGTLKKFEQTGQISLNSLLKIALCLGELDNFTRLFMEQTKEFPATINKLMEQKPKRQRGRQ